MADEQETPAPTSAPGKPAQAERDLKDFVLKAGDVSVRVEGGKVTALVGGQPVTLQALVLEGNEAHGFTLTIQHEPAPLSATTGPTAETAPAPPARRGRR